MKLAIIGSGASGVYVLKHFMDHVAVLGRQVREIAVFEQGDILGVGMPYNPRTTDKHNLSNISSEEFPELVQPFAEWLRDQDDQLLRQLGIDRGAINESEIYSRLALGEYLQAQYRAILDRIQEAGVAVTEHPGTRVTDVTCQDKEGTYTVHTERGPSHTFSRIVIATGHVWENADQQERGYYDSPWPIQRILPREGAVYDFIIGTLGASLSAFDVVSSLSRRHGSFTAAADGSLTYHPAPGTEMFRMVMHDRHGWLPHLQYEQQEPLRKIYRHVNRDRLFALIGDDGFLRLDTFFDKVCRPALSAAFALDHMEEMVRLLATPAFTLRDFVGKMERKHTYANAFEGLRKELEEAQKCLYRGRPIHWKEVLDDLMYTLNYHAELLPAEDHLQFHAEVAPFLMNVIAAMPLSSGRMLLALYDAGKLDLVAGSVELDTEAGSSGTIIEVVNGEMKTTHEYPMFIQCGGQKMIHYNAYPFPSLRESGALRRARGKFADPGQAASVDEQDEDRVFNEGEGSYLALNGIDVDASYRVIGESGTPNSCIHDISFTHTGGIRPYSYGLQACSATALIMIEAWVKSVQEQTAIRGSIAEVSEIYEQKASL